ncbi:formyltransferase family protein [Lentisphaerota bacterium WC36G]|nr:hypothetical protein LJT99_11730 [Lentisphaerae bacterium WC36]
MIKEYFKEKELQQRKVAVFLSGSGSNAEKLLEKQNEEGTDCAYEITVLLSDRTKNCRILELGKKYNIPVEVVDIKSFYATYGLKSISLALKEGQKVRELWTAELYKRLKAYDVDFAVLAGFIPLTNITGYLPCLNVHPGDLLIEDSAGKRLLVGLHEAPIELAIIAGKNSLRSSVIIAEPYSSLNDMDNGPLLGVSSEVAVDLQGHSLGELVKIYNARDKKRPVGGYKDLVQEVAIHNQEQLKVAGDHIVLPQTVESFAKGLYAFDNDSKELYFRSNSDIQFKKIKTIQYSQDSEPNIID